MSQDLVASQPSSSALATGLRRAKSRSSRLFGAAEFLQMLLLYRSCWLGGRYGGGKTALAFYLAGYLKYLGYVQHIYSNVPSVFSESLTPGDVIASAALVVDESWIFVDSWRKVKKYAAFSRKLNLYLLLPSVFPPHSRLRMLSCQRVLNMYKFGFPVWVYRWDLGMGHIREKGYFSWFNPAGIFGLYDTAFIPITDGGIVSGISSAIGSASGVEGQDLLVADDEDDRDFESLQTSLDDASERMERASEQFGASVRRGFRRRRY